MIHERFEFVRWAGEACRLIRFAPDRARVQEELMAHMEDAYSACVDAGEEPEQAARRAVERMGDAGEVARQLQRLYRPFWGFLWKYTRVLGAIAAVFLVWKLAVVPLFLLLGGEHPYGGADIAAYVRPSPDWQGEVLSDFSPEGRAEAGGYGISIERICFTESPTGYRSANFVLKVRHWNPWLRSPAFYRNLYAVDDVGNVYPPRGVEPGPENREVCGNVGSEGAFCSYYELWISHVDRQARSFTLGFDDYGVSWQLSFPVEGGIAYEGE